MSCAAMAGLAQNEAVQNQTLNLYSIDGPACERNVQIRDVGMESQMQAGGALVRNLCHQDRPADSGLGPWLAADDGTGKAQPVFLINSRNKTKSI